MKKLIASLLGLSLCGAPVFADPEVKFYTADALGCMKVGDCRDDVHRITDISQLIDHYDDSWISDNKQELTELIKRLNDINVELYVGHQRYFMSGQRAVYYIDVNRIYMNDLYGNLFERFLASLRHEGWHAAQDCMAGSLDNSLIAIIFDDELIPRDYKLMADLRYRFFAPNSIPWESEAIWAEEKPYMTAKALKACATGEMWKVYEPTPKTREWLIKEGYLK